MRERYKRNHELIRVHDEIIAGRKMRSKARTIADAEIKWATWLHSGQVSKPRPTMFLITTPEPHEPFFQRFLGGIDLATKGDVTAVRTADGKIKLIDSKDWKGWTNDHARTSAK